MSQLTGHKRIWRTALLVLLFVSTFGPWSLDFIAGPPMRKTTVPASSTHSYNAAAENDQRQSVSQHSWRLTPLLLIVPLSLVLLLGTYCAVAY